MDLSKLERPHTLAFTARLDVRSFATLAQFFRSQGVFVNERAKVANMSLEYVAQLVRTQHPEMDVTTNYEAVEIMKQLGLGDALSENNRNIPTLVKKLALEGVDGGPRPKSVSTSSDLASDIAKAISDGSASTLEEASAKAEEYISGMKSILATRPGEAVSNGND